MKGKNIFVSTKIDLYKAYDHLKWRESNHEFKRMEIKHLV